MAHHPRHARPRPPGLHRTEPALAVYAYSTASAAAWIVTLIWRAT